MDENYESQDDKPESVLAEEAREDHEPQDDPTSVKEEGSTTDAEVAEAVNDQREPAEDAKADEPVDPQVDVEPQVSSLPEDVDSPSPVPAVDDVTDEPGAPWAEEADLTGPNGAETSAVGGEEDLSHTFDAEKHTDLLEARVTEDDDYEGPVWLLQEGGVTIEVFKADVPFGFTTGPGQELVAAHTDDLDEFEYPSHPSED